MKKYKSFELTEIVFDSIYLLFALTAGLFLLLNGVKYGILVLVLAGGDAFHLVPRVFFMLRGKMREGVKILGIGKLITSVTMTVFYVGLFIFWRDTYDVSIKNIWMILVFFLGALRVFMCLLPGNHWLEGKDSSIYVWMRNIPFLVLGGIIAGLFALSAMNVQDGFSFMWLAIFLSFIFYFMVLAFSRKNKKFGAFMLPKTLAYIWMIVMGFSLM